VIGSEVFHDFMAYVVLGKNTLISMLSIIGSAIIHSIISEMKIGTEQLIVDLTSIVHILLNEFIMVLRNSRQSVCITEIDSGLVIALAISVTAHTGWGNVLWLQVTIGCFFVLRQVITIVVEWVVSDIETILVWVLEAALVDCKRLLLCVLLGVVRLEIRGIFSQLEVMGSEILSEFFALALVL
jgi:hypothetical protein